jgi:acyl-CoA synthetase (AMP-forming)/AMP-acid ligase II
MEELLATIRASLTVPGALFEVVAEDVRGNRMDVFRHRPRSLLELLERSSRFARREYVVDGDVRLDFAGNLAQAAALGAHLQREWNVRPGDRVALFAANRWEWVVGLWGIVSAGAIACPFNGWWTADEYTHAVGLVEPVVVLGDAARLERSREAALATPTLDLDELPDITRAFDGRQPQRPSVEEDSPALLIFTSGTTGRPKAVTVSHRSACGFVQLNRFSEAVGAVAMGGAAPLEGDELPTVDEVVLVTAPLFHVSMLQGALMMAIDKGSSLVLLRGRFDPEQVLATIERERVTQWAALGSAAPRVAASPAVGRHDTSSLRVLGVGGAPVSPAVQSSLRRTFPSAAATMGMGYTSTEGGAVVASIGGPEFLAHPTSTGRITVTTQVELRDPDGKPVAEGEAGEVHVRSPYVMSGYWNDPAASRAVLKDGGWLAMGDVARFEDGLLYIDSRARDMILVSAENVSPTEVEYCLEAHDAVAEAAVFAVDDELTGDAVCAVVSVHGAVGDVTEEQLAAWCRQSLAHYKVPTRWYVVGTPLPRTASGKLVKHQLRAAVERGEIGTPERNEP